MGTNKGASVWGTAWATGQYLQRVQLDWRALAPAAVLSLAGGFLGAWLLTLTSPDGLRKDLPWLLTGVLVYTWPGTSGGPCAAALRAEAEQLAMAGIAGVVGFTTASSGRAPATSSSSLFVRVLGYDFLHASAAAKLMNLASNVAAISLLRPKDTSGGRWPA